MPDKTKSQPSRRSGENRTLKNTRPSKLRDAAYPFSLRGIDTEAENAEAYC